jgi:hypothetical protein
MTRKEIVKRLGEHLGVTPKYLSVPSFNYQITTAKLPPQRSQVV